MKRTVLNFTWDLTDVGSKEGLFDRFIATFDIQHSDDPGGKHKCYSGWDCFNDHFAALDIDSTKIRKIINQNPGEYHCHLNVINPSDVSKGISRKDYEILCELLAANTDPFNCSNGTMTFTFSYKELKINADWYAQHPGRLNESVIQIAYSD